MPKINLLQKTDQLDELLNNVYLSLQGSIENLSNLIETRREECHTKGYHSISADVQGNPHDLLADENMLFCYTCELFFGKYDEIPYKVKPY